MEALLFPFDIFLGFPCLFVAVIACTDVIVNLCLLLVQQETGRLSCAPSHSFYCESFLKGEYYLYMCNVDFGKDRLIKVIALIKHLACLLFQSVGTLWMCPKVASLFLLCTMLSCLILQPGQLTSREGHP